MQPTPLHIGMLCALVPEAILEMKQKKTQTNTVGAARRVVRRYRSMGVFESRASLLRRLLRDARLERCVQMVP